MEKTAIYRSLSYSFNDPTLSLKNLLRLPLVYRVDNKLLLGTFKASFVLNKPNCSQDGCSLYAQKIST